MKHFKKYKKCIEFTQILILNKMDCAGRNSAGIFFRKNFLSGKNSSILEIEQKKLKKGDFVNGKIVDGRIGRTKRKRIR